MQQIVERQPRTVPGLRPRETQHALRNRQIRVRNDDVQVLRFEQHAFRGLAHGHARVRREQLRHHAFVRRIEGCWTRIHAMPVRGGRASRSFWHASSPPAEAPMPTTTIPPRGAGNPVRDASGFPDVGCVTPTSDGGLPGIEDSLVEMASARGCRFPMLLDFPVTKPLARPEFRAACAGAVDSLASRAIQSACASRLCAGRRRPDLRYATVPTCVASTRTLPVRAAWRSHGVRTSVPTPLAQARPRSHVCYIRLLARAPRPTFAPSIRST